MRSASSKRDAIYQNKDMAVEIRAASPLPVPVDSTNDQYITKEEFDNFKEDFKNFKRYLLLGLFILIALLIPRW